MTPDPARDLVISRVIKAPRAVVWSAWTEPDKFATWWIPAPSLCQVVAMDLRPGGALETRMSEDGGATFAPHIDGCYLEVVEGERLVWTNALTAGWRPADRPFITAIVTLADHAEGTALTALVMHKDDDTRALHEELGFFDGWGTVLSQLAARVEPA